MANGVSIAWFTPSGKFRRITETSAATLKDACELLKLAYPDVKFKEDSDSLRATIVSEGGRHGRNVAWIEETYEDTDEH